MKKTVLLIMAVSLLFGAAFAVHSNQSKTQLLENTVQVTHQPVDNTSEDTIAICYAEPPIFEMYQKAFTFIMNLDSALNTDMKYIALEYKSAMSDGDKQDITKVLGSYGVEVFEATLEDLSETEYSDEYGNLYGILIIIEDIEISGNITISFTKYRSGIGSISTKVTMIRNENGEWEVGESDAPVLAS